MSVSPARGWRPELTGRAGLVATGASVALTIAVGLSGTSLMEPPYPGRSGQPPWAFSAHLSPYLAVALTALSLAAGTAGLALTMSAMRRGWVISPRHLLLAGLAAAAVLTLVPPFGSSDPLSYAAYGRMLVTGHNPYTIGPDALARLGDPVARAVQDWKSAPSDYGTVATAGQALASLIGGTSARLTVFVLSVLDLAAFAVTAVLLHRMGRGDRVRQARAGLLWTCNPLLLQVLVAGEHVDSQAVVFGVAAIAVFSPVVLGTTHGARRLALRAAMAGALVGLGFAVKVTIALIGAGLAVAAIQAFWPRSRAATGGDARTAGAPAPGAPATGTSAAGAPAPGAPATGTPAAVAPATGTGASPTGRGDAGRSGWQDLVAVGSGLAVGFVVTAGAALAAGGRAGFRQTVQASSMVSFASPWRGIRAGLGVALGSATADDIVKTLAVILAVILAGLLLRGLPGRSGPAPAPGGPLAAVPADGSAGRHDATGQEFRAELLSRNVQDKRSRAYGGKGFAGARPATGLAGQSGAAGHSGAAGQSGAVRRAGFAGRTDPAARAALAFALGWLLAWPYLLPWYDALAWGLLPLVAASSLDWLLLARTAALAFGYLPARAAGIVIPAGLGWLRTVVREGVTPAVLAVVVIWLIVSLVRGRIRVSASAVPPAAAGAGAFGDRGAGADGADGADGAGPAAPSPAGTRRWNGPGRMGG